MAHGRRWVIVLVVVVGVAVTPLLGQRRGGGRMGGGGTTGRRGRLMGPVTMSASTLLVLFDALLTLSDAQKTQIGDLLDGAGTKAAPVAARVEAGKIALREAARDGAPADRIAAIADDQAEAISALLQMQALLSEEIASLLTAAQRPRFNDVLFDDIGEFLADARLPEPAPGTAGSGR